MASLRIGVGAVAAAMTAGHPVGPDRQGARRSRSHAPSNSRRKQSRSWSRLGRPCQNSIRSGTSRNPPQFGGRGIVSGLGCSALNRAKRSSRGARSAITALCGELQAPIREVAGRVRK